MMPRSAPPPRPTGERAEGVALVLSGGGARGAYQAGVLRALGRHFPRLRFPLLTGVSAGGINSVYLAGHPAALGRSAAGLAEIWENLEPDDVFRVDMPSLARQMMSWGARFLAGDAPTSQSLRGFADCSPLSALIRRFAATVDDELTGIAHNVHRGNLDALAITTLNYTTGETVTWAQGKGVTAGHKGRQRMVSARISVDHVLASAALPFLFPAVRLGDSWHGDGGIRLDAPLHPARLLGANRILAISPRHIPSESELRVPQISGYPPPAQILSQLTSAVFLDTVDRDAARLESINRLLADLPPEKWNGFRPIEILVIRPSQDLAALAARYEERLPRTFRYLMRSLGTRETRKPSSLSIVLFQPDYLRHCLALGEADAEARLPEIRALLRKEE